MSSMWDQLDRRAMDDADARGGLKERLAREVAVGAASRAGLEMQLAQQVGAAQRGLEERVKQGGSWVPCGTSTP